jgi:hypothetical protein
MGKIGAMGKFQGAIDPGIFPKAWILPIEVKIIGLLGYQRY